MTNILPLTSHTTVHNLNKRPNETSQNFLSQLNVAGVFNRNTIKFEEVKLIYNFSKNLCALKKSIIDHQKDLTVSSTVYDRHQKLIEKISELETGIIESQPKISTLRKNPEEIVRLIFTKGIAVFSKQMKETRVLLHEANNDFFNPFCMKVINRINKLNSETGASFVWMEGFILRHYKSDPKEKKSTKRIAKKRKKEISLPSNEQQTNIAALKQQNEPSHSREKNEGLENPQIVHLSPEQILENLAAQATLTPVLQYSSEEQNMIYPFLSLSPSSSVSSSSK